MKKFEISNFKMMSDFDIRILREENDDVDIIVAIGDRVVNLIFNDIIEGLGSRIQFVDIKNIIVRFNKSKNLNICTIHMLKKIDLFSAVANFEIDYSKYCICVEAKEGFVKMYLDSY
ncbi:hypothetical protein [Abyssisolibacter fermentans]|uniref:hypothetical protein n=1 Tax=Abyssisolibacter fermentans TaxID=1766203 RepID=UPI00082AAE0F|nr:hypothetical protein [Abyssisolibacter fermentans]